MDQRQTVDGLPDLDNCRDLPNLDAVAEEGEAGRAADHHEVQVGDDERALALLQAVDRRLCLRGLHDHTQCEGGRAPADPPPLAQLGGQLGRRADPPHGAGPPPLPRAWWPGMFGRYLLLVLFLHLPL